MTTTVSIDGALVPPASATISIFDRGFLYGDGLFEILRTHRGVAVDLDAHLERLASAARALALHVPNDLRAWTHAAITAAGSGEHRVRIVVTRGPGTLATRFAQLGGGRTVIVVEPLPPPPVSMTVALVDCPLPRRTGPAPKPLAFLDHLIARELAAAAGADEALRLDADGHVAECATANLFAVIAGTLVTPPPIAILPGITRARVLALAHAAGRATAERPITQAELYAANELFTTSSLRGIVPITRLDGEARPIGAITRELADAYFSWMRTLL